jgi:hypothetical protein
LFEGDIRADLVTRIRQAIPYVKTSPRYMPRTFQASHLPILMGGIGPADFETDGTEGYGSEVLSQNRDIRLLYLSAKLTTGNDAEAEHQCELFMHELHKFLFGQQRFVTPESNQVYNVRLVSDGGIQTFRFSQEQNAPEYLGVETLVSIHIDTYIEDEGEV